MSTKQEQRRAERTERNASDALQQDMSLPPPPPSMPTRMMKPLSETKATTVENTSSTNLSAKDKALEMAAKIRAMRMKKKRKKKKR